MTNDDDQIRDALRGVAEAGGAPDETAAWQSIRTGIDAGAQKSTRRKVLLGGTGLALLGVAAAFAIVAGTTDDDEAVEIGPAAEESTTTSTIEVAETTVVEQGGLPVTLPEHPVAVVVDLGGTQRLDLYDADTDAVVTMGLVETPFSLSDVSVRDDGWVVFTEELGDTSTVRMVLWDHSNEPTTPFGLGDEIHSGVFAPDGETFAFVEQGVTRTQGRIGIFEPGADRPRYLEWAADEDDFFLTQGRIGDLAFSPDGTRLAFTSSYEGSEIRVVDLAAADLSESTGVANGIDPAWLDDETIIHVYTCCYGGAPPEPSTLRTLDLETGGDVELAFTDMGESVDAAEGTIAYVGDGSVFVVPGNGTTEPLPVGGRALDVGL